jgi:hypothetical protein
MKIAQLHAETAQAEAGVFPIWFLFEQTRQEFFRFRQIAIEFDGVLYYVDKFSEQE